MEVRSAERWLMLRARRLMFCRARFRAWVELATIIPQNGIPRSGMRRRSVVNGARLWLGCG